MSPEDSVTDWLLRLQAGDQGAAQRLWQRCCARLIALALQKLRGMPRRAADEEDVALSAFDSFCRRAAQGQFPQLHDRDNLWRLLFTITKRKALKLRRDETRDKRGGGKVRGESVFLQPGSSAEPEQGLEQVAGREPTPDEAAEVVEEFGRLLDLLGDETLRAIALGKLEGDSNAQIAARLGCVEETVGRKIKVIRKRWEGAAP